MQVVGYDRLEPALLLADESGVEREPLSPGRALAYTLDERHCAGTLHDGGHVACDRDAAPYCEAHTSTWVCARCTGTCLKEEMDCYQEHAVYLAAFAPGTFKVGVTRLERLEDRLREQGADRAAHVRTVANGRIAREIEADLAAGRADHLAPTTLTDRVRVPTKVAGLGRTVDEVAWERLLAGFEVESRFAFDYGLDLAKAPVPETLTTGTVRGTKGRLLVLDRGGTTYAVDVRDLVGHELSTGASSRDRQSSLGAFS